MTLAQADQMLGRGMICPPPGCGCSKIPDQIELNRKFHFLEKQKYISRFPEKGHSLL